jgi:hypothetical protein
MTECDNCTTDHTGVPAAKTLPTTSPNTMPPSATNECAPCTHAKQSALTLDASSSPASALQFGSCSFNRSSLVLPLKLSVVPFCVHSACSWCASVLEKSALPCARAFKNGQDAHCFATIQHTTNCTKHFLAKLCQFLSHSDEIIVLMPAGPCSTVLASKQHSNHTV